MLSVDDDDDDDLYTAVAEQRREFMSASVIDNDLDFAFNLQLEEAINASLSFQQPSLASSSSASTSAPAPSHTVVGTSRSSPFLHYEAQLGLKQNNDNLDHVTEKLKRFFEDEMTEEFDSQGIFCKYMVNVDDDEGKIGEGIFSNLNSEIFRVYCKGLIEVASASQNCETHNKQYVLGGIGVAICDSRGNSLFKICKPLYDNSICKMGAEVKALIEGLNIALMFGIRRVIFHCDYYPIFQFSNGNWKPRNKKVEQLVSQLIQLRGKFTDCDPALVSSNEIKFALKLAREAIGLQKDVPAESSGVKSSCETCTICLENIDISEIFSVDDCKHRYCFSCMKQHVEVKLKDGILPKCPHEGCKSELKADSCSCFLTSTLVELMGQRLKEASVPVTEKVYCPYPKCSALMSKSEVLEYSKAAFVTAETSGVRRCIKCKCHFCVACSVPWHAKMTCSDYKARYPYPSGSEVQLKSLAETQSWRQCVMCKHMIELAEGCYHMTCRCRYEFCYTCGAEYKEKKATCKCPTWDEDFILDEDIDEDDWVEDEDEDEDEDEEAPM